MNFCTLIYAFCMELFKKLHVCQIFEISDYVYNHSATCTHSIYVCHIGTIAFRDMIESSKWRNVIHGVNIR